MPIKQPLVLAHRGGRQWAPENTMEAFRLSLDAGVDGIELDVHRCATGELVVIHDEDLKRTTNGVGLVKEASFAELQRLDAGSWYDHAFKGAKIPLLSDVLELINGKLLLNIEIKNTPVEYPGIEEDLLQLLSGYSHREKIIVSSFDHQLLLRIAELDRTINLAVLADALLIDLGSYAAQLNARYWHPCYDSIRQDAVQTAHKAGLMVNSWTLNAVRQWAQAIEMGVDGIFTDDPVGLMSFIQQIASATSAIA